MLYALIAKDKPDGLAQRLAVRPVHLDHLQTLGNRLRLAGALLDGDDKPEGSLMVLEADTIEEARTLFEADPFIKEGVFASYEIKPWRIAIDNTKA